MKSEVEGCNVSRNIYTTIAASHPGLSRGMVWCRICGSSLKVDSSRCLKSGWPKCCGQTMTIDRPDERKS